MKEKNKLVKKIDEILESKDNVLCDQDRKTLEMIRLDLSKASNTTQIRKALNPLLKLLHVAKEIIELLSG